jgi:hypothetical protein
VASCPESADFEPLVSRNLIREKVRDALKLYVGRGRRYSVKELANGAGIKDRVIEAAMAQVDDPEYRPLPLEALASIATFLKAPFASAFLDPCGLGAFELMDGQIPLPQVLATADAPEDTAEERKRLIRRLAELEGIQ